MLAEESQHLMQNQFHLRTQIYQKQETYGCTKCSEAIKLNKSSTKSIGTSILLYIKTTDKKLASPATYWRFAGNHHVRQNPNESWGCYHHEHGESGQSHRRTGVPWTTCKAICWNKCCGKALLGICNACSGAHICLPPIHRLELVMQRKSVVVVVHSLELLTNRSAYFHDCDNWTTQNKRMERNSKLKGRDTNLFLISCYVIWNLVHARVSEQG